MRILSLVWLVVLTATFGACGGGGGGSSGSAPVVEADPLVILTTTIPQAQADVAYSAFIMSEGGNADHTFKITENSPDQLPEPLFVNPTSGEIQGTPRAGTHGDYILQVEVFDGVNRTTQSLLLKIIERLSVATTIVAKGFEGELYSRQLSSVGGFQPQTWSVSPTSTDQLPSGLSMSASGRVTGTPTQDGVSMVTIAVTDGYVVAERELTFTISDAELEIQPPSLPAVDSGANFGPINLAANGGTGNYTWSLSPNVIDALPMGLMLSPTGVLSGTPAPGTDGFHSVNLLVSDGVNQHERVIVIQIGTPPLEITTAILPDGEVAEEYSHSMTAGGGSQNYTWGLAPTSNPLPDGLSISAAGLLSGRPSPAAQGTSSMTFSVNDGTNTHQRLLSITIAEPDILDVKYSWSQTEINHFLTRTQFGVTEAAQAAVTAAGGLENYVDQMLAKLPSSGLETQIMAQTIDNPAFPSRTELARWYEQLLAKSDAPFLEAMGFFWHDHFATGTPVLGQTNLYYTIKHINTLRHGALGNFRQLLFDVSIDDHMLVWLDGRLSTAGRPNENYAREFWELFTVGVDNGYDQDDIEEAARIFTGFRQSFNGTQNYMWFDERRHDTGDKHLFGRTITGRSGQDAYLEYYDAIDVTLDELDVAEYIVKKLWEWFVYENPEQEIIDGLAKTFRDHNWEIRPVLRQMLLSNAFYNTQGVKPREKSPVEFAVGLIRSTELDVPITVLDSFLNLSGQRPTDPPDVSGWPTGPQWLSADAMVQRANFAGSVRNERSFQAGMAQGVVNVLPSVINRTAPEVVDHMAGIFNLTLTADQRNTYIAYLNTTILNDQEIGSPFNGSDATHLEERARGLLYIMAQHPDYNFR